jgi:alpha-beta hydrolase superfamily lysophospholipase
MVKAIEIAILSLLILSVTSSGTWAGGVRKTSLRRAEPAPSPVSIEKWFPEEAGHEESPRPSNIRAVVVMIHGLNVNPEKMDSLIDLLNSRGAACLRLSLAGHHDDLDARPGITREVWLKEARHAYVEARKRADEWGVPIEFVGYSLGGALNIDLMANDPEIVRYDRMALLAPAIEYNAPEGLIDVMSGLFGLGAGLPSLNNPSYRSNPSTSFSMYLSLFDSAHHAQRALPGRVNVPTLVMIDPDDELVNFQGTKRWIQSQSLTEWQLIPVSNLESKLKPKYHHLIIDEPAVGAREWERMTRLLLEHLALL